VPNLISEINPLFASVGLGVALAVAWMVGAWLAHLRPPAQEVPHSKFGDAALTLLSLLLAFTFGTSIAKNDGRRLLVIQDAKAIKAFYDCASLLDEPLRSKLLELTRQYTHLCLELAGVPRPAPVAALVGRLNHLQEAMIALVSQATRSEPSITVPLVGSLNELVGVGQAETAALEDRLPFTVVLLLLFCSVAATLIMGREHHRSNQRDLIGTAGFILMVCLVIYVSADLNRPVSRLARVSQAPMERLLASMSP
jgi:hypothetical protein